jgi:hypothetical protein
MTNRIALLAAAALLPAGVAFAQSAAPGGNAPRAGTGTTTSTAARHNANPADTPATEDAQGSAQAGEPAAPASRAPTPAPAPPPTPAPPATAATPTAVPGPHATVRAAIAADLGAGAQVVDRTQFEAAARSAAAARPSAG